ncbi:MAG: hypothetical protein M1830_004608 [Pleopsidium flavum]|nr:MAG: hypothetical protein M1830_004608 [Pleopsidium flavum]
MAQPQQQQQPYLPRPFSPPRSTPSPGAYPSGAFLPPNKRQRLSPNPQSPYGSPSLANISLPSFNTPQNNVSPNGVNGAYITMAPPTAAGTMGPPSRPVEKATDMTELADVLVSSGVDLREEEAALTNPYLSSSQQNNNISFTSNNTSSFNSATSNGSNIGTLSASNSFSHLSQNVSGGKETFYGGGTFNQPAAQYQAPEAFAAEQRKKAAHRQAERRQYHLNDPFLFTGSLKRKVFASADANHTRLPMDGVYSPQRNARQPMLPVEVTAPDGTTVVATKGQSFVYSDAPMVDIFALLSLATEERIRSLIEDAATLALGRRIGSHGVVPPEWSDLATGNGAEPAAAMFTPVRSGWESAVSPKTNPLKCSYSSSNKLPTPISDGARSPIPTISFPNTLAQTLRNMSQSDRTFEESRLTKRARRTTGGSTLTAEGSRSGSTPLGTPGSVTSSGLLGERAPDVKVPTKKAAKKEAEAKATEAQQHQNTNATVSMALGSGGGARNLFGKKKGGYSWLDKKPGAGQMTGFPVPSKLNTADKADASISGVGGSSSGGVVAMNGSLLPPGGKRIGEWREDKERGAGIQLRDLVSALEGDGKEKRVLARLYSKMSSRD